MQDIAALEEIGFVSIEKSISGSGSSRSGEFNSLICPAISWYDIIGEADVNLNATLLIIKSFIED